jgi:di/tricarboxylate transporter
MQTALLVLILLLAVVFYVTQWLSIEVTSLGVIVALVATSILEPAEALSGFSNPATVTVVAMLVLSAGIEKAGLVDYVAARLATWAEGGLTRLLCVLAVPAVGFSAFLNNTPIVAMLIPVAILLARRADLAPSKVLLPLSYLSILGGTCTLIGTSTNLLVDGLYRQSGGPGFGMFEFSAMGLVYLGVGGLYVLLVAPRVLPTRLALNELSSAAAPGHFVAEMMLTPDHRLAGKRVGEAFPHGREIRLLEVVRDEEPLLAPDPDLELRAGDVLFLEYTARSVKSLVEELGLEYGIPTSDEERVRISGVDLRLAEAVITPSSRFIGRRVRALGLSRKRGVQVLGLRRLGRLHQYDLRELRLRAGDVLLVQGEPIRLRVLQEEGDVLLVEGVERELTFPRQAPVALATLVAVVGLATLGVLPIPVLALAGIAVLLVTRCLNRREAMRAIDPAVLLLLAATIPLGLAMERSGLAHDLAARVVGLLGDASPQMLIAGVYVFTGLCTAVLSNNATAVLLTPIALDVSKDLGIDPKPLLVAIAFGASAAFATPIGYQTNTMVMGPGGYRFEDYLKFGLPLNAILAVAAALLIPVFWPL